MNRKLLFGIMAVLVLAVIGGSFLLMQGTKQKVYRVGVLSGLEFFADTTDGFKAGMAELGYEEGSNIVYDVERSNIDMAKYGSILRKFVADKVDLIFVFPTEAAMMAKAATKETNIPVVFTNAFIEDTGLVNSVREPGGNITGVRWAGPDLALQRYEIMRELVPQAKRMWIPYQKDYPIVRSQLKALRQTFAADGLTMIELPSNNVSELNAQLRERAGSFDNVTDVILMIVEPLAVTPGCFEVMAKFAAENKIPVGGAFMSIGGYESLFGLTPQSVPQGKQAAFLADKILRGASAGAIPVVSAESYFQINYKAAKKLGLNVSEGLLGKAKEIIR